MKNRLAFDFLIVSLLVGIFISIYFDLPYRLIGIAAIIIVLVAMVYIASLNKPRLDFEEEKDINELKTFASKFEPVYPTGILPDRGYWVGVFREGQKTSNRNLRNLYYFFNFWLPIIHDSNPITKEPERISKIKSSIERLIRGYELHRTDIQYQAMSDLIAEVQESSQVKLNQK